MVRTIGEQVGNYRLLRLLGQGGFADVYLGEHIYLRTQAAIKTLHTHLSEEHIETFRQEALTIAHLTHPNIVRVLDFNIEETLPFFIMDYAANGSLRQQYARGSRLTAEKIVVYTKQLASALQYAHEHNVIHRDVKPANMLLGQAGQVLLSDFGISLIAESSLSQKTKDEIVGTLAYMAPEQINGKTRPASDQYSLAAVVYEWISGRRLFSGSYFEIITQHLSAEPAPLSEQPGEVPEAVEQVVLRALAKDYHQRFPRVQDFADALEEAYRVAGDGDITDRRNKTVESIGAVIVPVVAIEREKQRSKEVSAQPGSARRVVERLPTDSKRTLSPTVKESLPTDSRRTATADASGQQEQLFNAATRLDEGQRSSSSGPTTTWKQSLPPLLWSGTRIGFRLVRRGVVVLFFLLLLLSLALCGLGYGIYQYVQSQQKHSAMIQCDQGHGRECVVEVGGLEVHVYSSSITDPHH